MNITQKTKIKAYALLGVMLFDMLLPLRAVALTSGPSQPEVQSFEPVGTSQMVDAFSGDFNYNIPLMDVNGYPINIAYHAGATMDQEASWVGLGWNINPGTINRGMRGLPDDMDGEYITQKRYVRPNRTVNLKFMAGAELFGMDGMTKLKKQLKKIKVDGAEVGLNFGLRLNNYKGVGWSFGSSLDFSKDMAKKMGLNAGISMDYSDDGGIDIQPDISLQQSLGRAKGGYKVNQKFSIGGGFNSREGLKGMNLGHSVSGQKKVSKDGKKLGSGRSAVGVSNAGITYSTATQAYTPGISSPMAFISTDFSFQSGLEMFGTTVTGTIRGSYSSQWIPEDKVTQSKKGYGYLYEQDSYQGTKTKSHDFLLDFNRENDGQLTKVTPFLPWVNHTFDMYSVSAQGVGGTYRLHRNDIPMLNDPYQTSKTNGTRLGFDLGATNALKGGVNLGYSHSSSESGMWSEDNLLKDRIGFMPKKQISATKYTPEYEPAYFREVNELVPQSSEYLDLVGEDNLVAPALNGYDLAGYMRKNDANDPYHKFDWDKNENVSTERVHRNKLLQYKTVEQADYCLDKEIKSYPLNTLTYVGSQLQYTGIERTTHNRKHITEIEILNTDGSRHVFGIPAYNNYQVEKTFRVDVPTSGDKAKGLAYYSPYNGDTKNNKKGVDHFFTSTTTPEYAHSYLITGVLSPDYVDLTGDGITDDDLGSAVKFNYTRTSQAYGWRAPYEEDRAKHVPGLQSDGLDDIGNYVYGTKEIWYTHSIEGKTHIALFELSTRSDGLGVVNEDGGKNTTSYSYKLDRIKLYSKRELKAYGEDAVPIKTVHFVYNYESCKGVSNQANAGDGKLTLEEIYFTYGNSNKGKLNSYKFHYNQNNSAAYQYHLLAYDAWGTYTPPVSDTDLPTNAEYAYTTQDQDSADVYAALWNLNKIELPSGGVINIEYEADDYGYVQDKRAMHMFKIVNFGREDGNGGFTRENKLYSSGVNKEANDIIFFELKEDLTDDFQGREVIRKEYLKDIEELQVTVNVDIKSRSKDTTQNYEYVKTYVNLAYSQDNGASRIHCGITDNGSTGWVRMEKVHIRDNNKGEKISPIAKAAWQFTRMNLDFLIHPGSDRKRNKEAVTPGKMGSFAGSFVEIASMATGPNRMMMSRKFCQNIVPAKSWVRLNDPDKSKIGGGHRVKQISLSDEWSSINTDDPNAQDASYGQQYDYTVEAESQTDSYTSISSGVATFEPMAARDVNPFVKPHYYDQARKGVPDERYTFEFPIGESFYPAASVGYSKVTVRSIDHEYQSPQHRTGYSVSEFYTYKDFPVVSDQTEVENIFSDESVGFTFGYDEKTAAAVQGYIIELNDMHGKPKATWSYSENDVLVSGAEYKYKVDENGDLDNDVLAIERDGTISTKTFGVNVDMAVDGRYFSDNFFSADADVNLDIFAAGILPIFIPTLWPDVKFNATRVNTATSIKVVRKLGLLTQTVAYKEGSEIATDQLLFDAQTGQALLSSIDNEFGDKTYQFNYPAHWAYDTGMGCAFENWGLEIKGLAFVNGTLVSTNQRNLHDYLVPGDECIYKRPGKAEKQVWVMHDQNDSLILIDKNGKLVYDNNYSASKNGRTTLRVIRSGRKNMAAVSIGSVVCMQNPVQQSGSTYYLSFDKILSTSAVEYKDDWKTDLSLFVRYDCDTMALDLFTHTLKLIDEVIPDSAFYTDYKYIGQSYCTETYYDTNYPFSSWDSVLNYNYPYTSTVPSVITMSGMPEPHTVTHEYYLQSYRDSVHKDSTLDVDSLQTACDNHDISEITFTDPWWYCNYYDTAGLWIRCKINYGPKVLRGGNYQADQTSDLSPVTPEFTLDYSDTAWFYDSLSTKYFGVADDEINDQYPAHVYARNKYNGTDTLLHPLYTTLDSLYLSSDFAETDTCDPLLIDTPILELYTYKDRYEIRLTGKCDQTCKITIDNQGVPVKNITEILSWEMKDNQSAYLEAEIENQYNETDTVSLLISSSCGDFFDCTPICEVEDRARRVNPYLVGLKGNWRPFRSWTYVEDRVYDQAKANPQEDGAFASYTPFWTKSSDDYEPTGGDKWVWTSEISEYSPFGMELENKDPLGRYSSALYGYSQTLPTAVASNTEHRQLWFEGFEEYTYMSTIWNDLLCPQFEMPYTVDWEDFVANQPWLDHDNSHSGNVSLRVTSADSLIQEIALDPTFVEFYKPYHEGQEYITDTTDQILPFRPQTGKYLASLWIRETHTQTDTLHDSTYVVVEFEDEFGAKTRNVLRPTGLIIEEWQRVEEVINVPEDAKIMRIKYVTEASYGWFDDFRMFPYSGNMKSYSYDFRTLRLMAELDENNYATFYEYDLEGNLVRVKKETERGIKTLQENRQHQKSN